MDNLRDVAAERAVLAGVFQYGQEAYIDAADLITGRTFTMESSEAIWKCLSHILESCPEAVPDIPSVLSAAKDLGLKGFFDQPRELDYLRAIKNTPTRPENVRRLAARIRKLEVARLLDQQLEVARQNLYGLNGSETIEQILSCVETPIFDFTTLLASTDSGGVQNLGEGASEFLQHLMDDPREMVGISTGFRRYDEAIGGGLRAGSMDVIAARPKTGKTQLLDNFALNIVEQGIPVLNLDTEMSREEHIFRITANMTGVPVRDIERGKCGQDPVHRRKVLEAAEQLAQLPYSYRCITGEPFEETLAHMRRWVLRSVGLDDNGKAKPCVIFYDYLKLMSSDGLSKGNLAEYQMLGFLATALKNFATRYGVPILAFTQLNKEMGVSQSDRIIWFCTSLTHFERKTEDELTEDAGPYTHKLITTHARHGEGMADGDYINLLARYKIGRIEEGPAHSELFQRLPKKPQGRIEHEFQNSESISFGNV